MQPFVTPEARVQCGGPEQPFDDSVDFGKGKPGIRPRSGNAGQVDDGEDFQGFFLSYGQRAEHSGVSRI